MKEKEIMSLGVEQARKTMYDNFGGPFGAVITDKNNHVIAVSSNTVLYDLDPTAHAEVNVIRKACEILKTYDLSDYILYATGYPCPMCLGAIMWANIKTVYYGTDLEDAKKIGFKDEFIYDFIKNKTNALEITQVSRDECIKLFNEYAEQEKTIY